jgi:hypothetical protein
VNVERAASLAITIPRPSSSTSARSCREATIALIVAPILGYHHGYLSLSAVRVVGQPVGESEISLCAVRAGFGLIRSETSRLPALWAPWPPALGDGSQCSYGRRVGVFDSPSPPGGCSAIASSAGASAAPAGRIRSEVRREGRFRPNR